MVTAVAGVGAALFVAVALGIAPEPTAALAWPATSGLAMKSGFSQLAPGSGVNSLFSVKKSANCLIRLSPAESSFSWWPHDWMLIGLSSPAYGDSIRPVLFSTSFARVSMSALLTSSGL